MKRCWSCKKEKEEKKFSRRKSRRNGITTECKKCASKRVARIYHEMKNNKEWLKRKYNSRHKGLDRNRNFVMRFLEGKKCTDCPNLDTRVFEFDHVKGKKFKDINKMVAGGYSLKVLIKEIEKCDIVCANCHRIRTLNRSGSYRLGG